MTNPTTSNQHTPATEDQVVVDIPASSTYQNDQQVVDNSAETSKSKNVTAATDRLTKRQSTVAPKLTLSWKNVTYSVPIGKGGDKKNPVIQMRTLLDGVEGTITNGEVVAIMGGSGAGKSTMLNCLAGRIAEQKGSELSGEILLNGQPRNPETWIKTCAYVEQEDLLFTNLSVQETLSYAAKLKLPKTVSEIEKAKKVNDIIMSLGLDGCRNTWIGDASYRGISGGEKKRVSIGMELVSDPDLLFLDEPTSGLDASTSLNIIGTIKQLAKERGIVVLMTIHQPRTDILDMFDKIILLSVGKTVWYGPTEAALLHFEKLGYPLPNKTNPSDFFLDIITLDQRSPELKEKSLERINKFSEAWKAYVAERKKNEPISPIQVSDSTTANTTHFSKNSWFYEFGVLFNRNMKDVMRSKATIGATFGQAIFLIILLGFIFFQLPLDFAGQQSRFGFLFFIVINQSFGVVMPFIGVFPSVRAIFKRERNGGTYRASTSYLSKVASTLPLTWANAVLMSAGLYFLVGLQATVSKFFIFVLVIVVHSTAAISLAFMIGSAVPTAQVGQIIAPLIISIFLIFAGQLLNIGAVSWAFKWIQYISILSYSYKALIQNEYSGLVFNINDKPETGEQFIERASVGTPDKFVCVIINIGIGILFLGLGYIFYSKTTRPLQRLELKK